MLQSYIPVYVLADSSIGAFEKSAIERGTEECAPVFGCVFIRLFQDSWGDGPFSSADKIIRAAKKDNGIIDVTSAMKIMSDAMRTLKYPGAMMLFTRYDLKNAQTWCFGVAQTQKMCSIQSTCRYKNMSDEDFVRCVARTMRHELGHLFRCANDDKRSNTIEKLGTHCTNSYCSMRQTMNIDELINAARHENPRNCFCAQCREDMRQFKQRYERNHRMISFTDIASLARNYPG